MRASVRQLECLVAAAQHLNFRAAARECHISQPALSGQIARLESELGVQLFERSKRRVLLTPVGEAVAERAKRILTALDEIAELARAHADPLGGQLRLGVIPTVAPYVMPRALTLIRRACPKLEVLLREEQTERSLELLDAGKLDALLLALEVELGDVSSVPLFRDPFMFAAAASHPLSQRKTIRPADLVNQRVLLLEDGHCLKDQAWAICEAQGVKEFVDFRATSLGTLAQMVSSGAGITLLPRLSVPTVGQLPGIVIRPFTKPVPYRTIGLCWRPSSPRRVLFETLAGLLRELADPPAAEGPALEPSRPPIPPKRAPQREVRAKVTARGSIGGRDSATARATQKG